MFGSRVARRVEGELLRAFSQLAAWPRSGHARPDLTPDSAVRFWSVGPTLIAYREVSDGIEVRLVERGEADWGRMLDDAT
jgi:plasmid stabilization system protein ParE